MNQIMLHGSTGLSMSSREIAELCEKRHDHVMRDIKKMLDDLDVPAPKFGGTSTVRQPNGGEREVPCYLLPKDLTLTLVAGYNVVLRKRIIDRWLELEGQAAAPDLSDPVVLVKLLAEHAGKRIEAERRAEMAEGLAEVLEGEVVRRTHQAKYIFNLWSEDVRTYERIMGTDGSVSITEVAKILGLPPKALFAWLHDHKWVYRRNGSAEWIGYQNRCDAGLIEHKTVKIRHRDGSETISLQARITAAGINQLARLIAPGQKLML